jgi:hypothetical protein
MNTVVALTSSAGASKHILYVYNYIYIYIYIYISVYRFYRVHINNTFTELGTFCTHSFKIIFATFFSMVILRDSIEVKTFLLFRFFNFLIIYSEIDKMFEDTKYSLQLQQCELISRDCKIRAHQSVSCAVRLLVVTLLQFLCVGRLM